jgi:mono/diheme cytochrome c family protein
MNYRKQICRRAVPLAAMTWVLAVAIVCGGLERLDAQQPQADAPKPAASPDGAFLTQYCIGCHNQRAKIGGLALDALDLTRVGPDAETWEKAVKKIRTGMMPPAVRSAERRVLDGLL